MTHITRSVLKSYAQSSDRINEARQNQTLSKSAAQASVFLSHSHHDEDLVKAAMNFLANEGVAVYVDWLDEGMPEHANAVTAKWIKHAIAANGHFVLLATEQSLTSRWVPWELGCADGIKGQDHMAVLVVQEDWPTFAGNEYLALYPTIEKGQKGCGVFPAGQSTGVTLASWLKQ